MTEKVAFDLVAPDRLVSSGHADMVVVPGTDGDMGVLFGHMALVSSLRPGLIDIYQSGQVTHRFFVSGGFVEVNQTSLTVLADSIEDCAALSLDTVRSDLKEAQERLEIMPDAQQSDVYVLAERVSVLERVLS